jgi:hypothetical protein
MNMIFTTGTAASTCRRAVAGAAWLVPAFAA